MCVGEAGGQGVRGERQRAVFPAFQVAAGLRRKQAEAPPDDLPDASSINKQITYGEYLEKHKNINADSLFNAFVMPYNQADNPFGLRAVMENIGEATGDWRHNQKYYERIQGILIDTRYLMYHYLGKPLKGKALLADCIEAALGYRSSL